MDDKTSSQSILEHVTTAIKSGEVTMRPKWHFVLRATLAAIGSITLLLTLLYLASFIIFILRRSGVWIVPVFGLKGMYVFLFSLPWLLIGLAIIFVIILEILVKRYAFAYRLPLLCSVGTIVALIGVGGFIVAKTSFHHRLVIDAKRNHLSPMAGQLYRAFEEQKFGNINPGEIINLTPTGFVMRNHRDEIMTVVITPRTRLPFEHDFSAGESVVVFGEHGGPFEDTSTTIEAMGIKKFSE